MAVASQRPILSLDEWAKIFGANPLHFNMVQVMAGNLQPATTCASIVLQYSWQGADKVGREEVAAVILDTEAAIARELGFSPGPTYAVGEVVPIIKPAVQQFSSIHGSALSLANGMFIEGGLETWTQFIDGQVVVYSDSTGDGFMNIATMTVDISDPSLVGMVKGELSIFYPGQGPTDSVLDSGEGFEIRPLYITFNGTPGTGGATATVIGQSAQFVAWEDLADYNPVAVDGIADMPGSFLTTVDVYRHYTDTSQSAQFRWNNPAGAYGGYAWFWTQPCTCAGVGVCAACSFTTQAACMQMDNPRLGQATLQPGTWDATSKSFTSTGYAGCSIPDLAIVNYKHGLVDPRTGQMPQRWKNAVAYLAATRLDRPLCACNQMENFATYWAQDLAAAVDNQGHNTRMQVTQRITENPLGTNRACEFVWRMIQNERIGRAPVGL